MGIYGDLIIDEEAFDKAVEDFSQLSSKLQALRTDVEEIVNGLKTGFDTPAGRLFINSCEKNLFEPLDAQKIVLDHISSSLKEARQTYSSVFDEYDSFQTTIKESGNK